MLLRKATIAAAIVWTSGLGIGIAGAQTVIHVDDDAPSGGDGLSWETAYDSLHTALSAAKPGDQIWVAAGTYVGNFTLALEVEMYGGFAGTETELSQRDWTTNETILDGNRTGSVVTSPPGANETTRIDGFTITNGSGSYSDGSGYGGGLYLVNSSPAIANNTITGNRVHGRCLPVCKEGYGGGLYLYNSNPTIENNTISGNIAYGAFDDYYYSLGYGGGLYLDGSSPAIENNTITGNTADGDGGGLYLYDSSGTIANNLITVNCASDDNGMGGGTGGGLYLRESSPIISDNFIAGNSAWESAGGAYLNDSSPAIMGNKIIGNNGSIWGGGLYLYKTSSTTIANNMIEVNTAGIGAGLYLYKCPSSTIVNNVIAGNSGSDGAGLYLYSSSPTIANTIVAFNKSGIRREDTTSTLTLSHNCVYGNIAYDYEGLSDPTGINGNISADPLLADLAYGNAHIQPDSPCVNTGRNAYAFGDFDIDGEPRILPTGGSVDIGADESDGTQWPVGPYVIVRVSPLGDDTHDGSSWAFPKQTVQAGINMASMLGGEVWVQAATYEECIKLLPYAYAYGGFAGGETRRDERDFAANVTTLDGQWQGSVVTAQAGYGAVGAIDGFTITNGDSYSGGGLYVESSSPAIVNNKITGNRAYQGGGLCLSDCSSTITNNIITGNSGQTGGGAYMTRSHAKIANNTIAGNSGYGVYVQSSSPTIANTIVAFNSHGIYRFSGAPMLRNNCVYGNTAFNYDGLDGLPDPTGADGNISADPLLVGLRYGSLHIQPNSPCVDAGRIADAHGELDMDGEPRIQGGTVDIGADESDGTGWPTDPHMVIRVSPTGDDDNDGSSWALAKRTVQAALDTAFPLGGEVWVQSGTYYERITLPSYVHLYGGFAGDETVRDQRDWNTEVTILDGQQEGHVVTSGWGYLISTIDGFTITNGNAKFGGGVYMYYSSPAIVNNTIRNNTSSSQGGGLYLSHSYPTIASNSVIGNTASSQGGGLYLSYSSPVIVNNTITGNTAVSYYGGGLCGSRSSPLITNSTVAGNGADYGGGLYFTQYCSPTIANTIVAFNSSGIHGYEGQTGTITLLHNCVYGNTEYDYNGLTDLTGINGNISTDPVLIRNPDDGGDGWGDDPDTPGVDEGGNDDYGDLRLSSGSPCIDAGDNFAVPADEVDLDEDGDKSEPMPFDFHALPRFADDSRAPNSGHTDGTWPIVDMGAFERADCNGNTVEDAEDIAGGSSNDENANGYPDECEPAISIVASMPPDCAIDARQPCQPDGSNPQGWHTIELDLDNAGLYLATSDVVVTEEGDGVDGTAPYITGVEYTGWHTVKVHLSEPIEPGGWTTIRHIPTAQTVSLGYLPSDANADTKAAPADIVWLIDCLNGVISCETWQCDVDRSDVCGPPDILRVIDLLNGAGVYEPWLNVSIPECPHAASVLFDLPAEIAAGSTIDMDDDANPDTGKPILRLTGAPPNYEVLFFASADGALPPGVLLTIDNYTGKLHIDPESPPCDDIEITVQVFVVAGLLAEASDTFMIVAAP